MWKAFVFLSAHYAFLTGIGILSYGIGRRLTQRIHYDSPAEQFSFCITLGLGFIAYLLFFIGALGILYHGLVLAVMGVIFLLGLSVWKEVFQGASSVRWRSTIFFSLATLLFIPVLLMPLYPPTTFDSTMYHLAYAKIYTQTHRLTLTPYLRYPVSPQTNEMLFTLAFLLYDDVSAQLIQFLMMGVLGIGLFALGRRLFSQRAGVWAAAIYLSNPMVLWLGASAYIDIGLALFVMMATYALFNWMELREKAWLILGAFFLGFAAGSKYSALFFLILFSLIVLYIGLRDRKPFGFLLFIALAVCVAFPWYFRNWYYTGNPVFPFFGQIFGYGLLNYQDLQRMLNDLLHAHGTGKSFQSFLLLPWNLAFKQTKYLMEAPYSKIYLFALPFLLLSLRRPKIRDLFIIVFLYTLFWFSSAQILRYLIPIIPLLSLIVAASIEQCLAFIIPKRLEGVQKGFLTLAISVALFIPGWFYATEIVCREGFPPSTKIEQVDYLAKKLPSFRAYQYLNQTRGRNYVLYALFDANMAYFSDGTFMGDWFGKGRFERIYSQLSNPRDLHRELQLLGANYFLIRRDRVGMSFPEEDGFFQSHFKQVYKSDHVLLFEIL